MPDSVFYSWQSDLPNSINRGLIEAALERAAKRIRADESVVVDPVIDRDTAGVPGAPEIAATIFAKIDLAALFVCDVSIINSDTGGRPTPNPNVLIELGYAKKAMGPDRVIMLMNTTYGGPETLPFDLRTRRVITYKASSADKDRSAVRRELERKLEEALRIGLETAGMLVDSAEQPEPLSGQLTHAIENDNPNQVALARRYMSWLGDTIEEQRPHLEEGPEVDEAFVAKLPESIPIVLQFTEIASAVATMNAGDTAVAMYEGFDRIIDGYDTPRGFSGTFLRIAFDYHKFLGHELFVVLTASLMHHRRWKILADILDRDIFVARHSGTGSGGVVPFVFVSQHVKVLEYRNQRLRLGRASLRADMLRERHGMPEMSERLAPEAFVDADLFLFLRSQLAPEKYAGYRGWMPWSTLNLGDRIPRFLAEMTRRRVAEELLEPLGVTNLETLREGFGQSVSTLASLFDNAVGFFPLPDFDPEKIGTR